MPKVIAKPLGLYFEELEVGDIAHSAGRTVTETDIVNFMGLSGVFEELHMNVEYIKKHSIFGRRIAPGPLTFVIAEGLALQLGLVHHTGMAMLGIENTRFLKPVYCGDTIRVDIEIASKRETSKPDRGVVDFAHRVINQDDVVVMTMNKIRMIRRRTAEEAAAAGLGGAG